MRAAALPAQRRCDACFQFCEELDPKAPERLRMQSCASRLRAGLAPMSLEKAFAGRTGRSRQLGGARLSEQISMSRYIERVNALGEIAVERKTARSLLNGSEAAALR